MTVIHAHTRTKVHTVEFNGRKHKFAPNEEGHVVADIADKATVARLLELPEGYREYSDVRLHPDPLDDAPEVSPFIISVGESDPPEQLDLRKLTKAQLVQFAAENELEGLDATIKVDDYRQAVLDALTKAA